MIKKTALSFILLIPISKNCTAEIYQFHPIQVEIDQNTQFSRHQVIEAGFAKFHHNVRVRVFNISILNPIEGGLLFPQQDCKTGCDINMTLEPAIASQMKIYNIGTSGFFLVPKTWQKIEANMGANGDMEIKMQSDDQQEHLMVYNVPACVSCALSNAAIFFPEAAREYATEYDIHYKGNNANLNIVYPQSTTVYFDYQLSGQHKTHGVARYKHHQDRLYDSMHVTLADSKKILASAMLNFFLLHH